MTLLRRAAVSLTLALALAGVLLPGAAIAASPAFGTPTAVAELGQPITFSSEIRGDDIAGVDVLVRLAFDPTTIIIPAQPGPAAGMWRAVQSVDIGSSAFCECLADGNSAPNTRFEFQFRVRAADGTTTVGPLAQGIVEDTRFQWRSLSDGLVVVHWYAGDDAFARGAADLANEAIDRASQLLGTTLPRPVDLFIYDTQPALLEAVSPNRENISGQAHQDIQTMFVWLPQDVGIDTWAGEVVRHELTHLVFDAAVRNPYHDPPRWLNEGVAVYLSVGYNDYYRSLVTTGVRTDTLIPLDGIAGLFPATETGFYLGYGESVAAVDFFVRTHGEPKLWELVRSYAQGMTDDDAFTAATGAGVDDFNSAWFTSLNEEVPAPLGPQPAPTGPIPPDWAPGGATPGPTLAPGQTPATPRPTATPAPTPTGEPGQPGAADGLTRVVTVMLWLIVIVALVSLIGYLLVQRSRARRPPGGW